MLRTLWYGPASKQWFQFLDSDAHMRELTRAHPALAEKLHRPYRRSDLDVKGRLLSLLSHHRAVGVLGWQSLLLSLCERPLTIATLNGKDGVERHLVLDCATQFAKEGELCLHLFRGRERLYTAALCLLGSSDEEAMSSCLVLDVGCLQGPGGESAADVMRETTKALHGVRPHDFMATALRYIAEQARARWVVGVSSARHIYRHWRKRRAISFNYDAFWQEQHGHARDDGDFEIAPLREFSPIEELPSKKRSEARRRRELLTDCRRQIAVAFAPWARAEHCESGLNRPTT